ncbi:ABC transporter ATP-binding protein [Ignavigranum ruoffiae]|uniref:ABC transporter ATP-binding protein n=1 Tax=Ignavigranum ruoffiae TaxID=89093 RepID=UPI0024AD1100|nr:ABC transporter ATP-binding protein [Ignavigranum ruoffiae]
MKAIEFKNVSKTYLDGKEEFLALKSTNLAIETGEFVAIIGPSGSGKSTFLTLAGGLQTPTEGEILINGQSIYQLSAKELGKIRFKEIGFILQSSNLIPYLSVRNQFRLIDKINKKSRQDEMEDLLAQLEISGVADKYPEDLSGGQKQRVAIAKALYNNPTLILADEPTASLDSERAFEVVKILAKESKAKNKAIVMVTHDLRLIDQCDRVFEMSDGVLTEKK